MAAITFAQRIAQDLRILIAAATIVDETNQRGAGTSEVTAITDRAALLAAARVQSELGDVGAFDDAAASTAGDLAALDIGIRLAKLRLDNVYTAILSPDGREYEKDVIRDLKELAAARRLEAPGKVANSGKTAHDVRMDKLYPSTDGQGDTTVVDTILNNE
jgi:shikimate kinase